MRFGAWLAAHYEEQGPVRGLAFVLEMIAAITLMALMLLTCMDVAGRYFLDNSIDGVTELTEIAIAIIIFAEMPIVTWRGTHVVVDVLDSWLGNTLVKCFALLSALLIATSLYFLGHRIYELAARSILRKEVTEYLQLSVGIIVQYIAVMSWVTALGMLTYGCYRLLFVQRD